MRWSAGSRESQFFCFLPTKDHFSSTWTWVVRGGKPDQLVVELACVRAGAGGVACDGVLIDAREPPGLSDPAPVGQVREDVEGFVVGQAGIEQGGALAFGEAVLAAAAVEEPPVLLTVIPADGEVAGAPHAILGTGGVLAAKAGQIVGPGARGG